MSINELECGCTFRRHKQRGLKPSLIHPRRSFKHWLPVDRKQQRPLECPERALERVQSHTYTIIGNYGKGSRQPWSWDLDWQVTWGLNRGTAIFYQGSLALVSFFIGDTADISGPVGSKVWSICATIPVESEWNVAVWRDLCPTTALGRNNRFHPKYWKNLPSLPVCVSGGMQDFRCTAFQIVQ